MKYVFQSPLFRYTHVDRQKHGLRLVLVQNSQVLRPMVDSAFDDVIVSK
jgi:hypothetical protein